MQNLSQVWQQVEKMIADGLSLIPVRDKPEGTFAAKTPYKGWKDHQTTRITKEALWHQMEHVNTNAVAIICGSVSGALECIDIDVKYKPGVDAIIFTDLQSLYPDLYARLRIHKSPSGGYHILYRVEPGSNPIPGNTKLAGRLATAEELAVSPKEKTKNFIETRGEGGYVLAPPSMGYSVTKPNAIPVLSWSERCSIIELCLSYNELVKIAKEPKPTKYDYDYYDENPFDHFNNSPQAELVLANNGWTYYKENSNFVWYTRPGKPTGVSASWNKSKRVFFIFTSESEFEVNTGYKPATALSILAHGGDKKKTYQHLVQSGYGRIKARTESRLVKAAALRGTNGPANLSDTARAAIDTTRQKLTEMLPYGTFWDQDEEDNRKYHINREQLYYVAESLGFRSHQEELYRIQGKFIHRQEPRQFFDAIKGYIKEEDYETYQDICNSYESFLQRSGTFTTTRLPILDTAKITKDTRSECSKFYQNGYLKITATGYEFHNYDDLPGLIFADRIQPRDFTVAPYTDTLFYKFCDKAFSISKEEDYYKRILGYLAHEFKDSTTGYIIVLVEICADPRNGGGSGKNIFSSLLNYTTTFKNIPGAQVKFDERFLQAWDGQRVFAISDVPKHFDYLFLKELSTGSGILKKLFKNEVEVPVEQMPKFIIQTNYSYEITDGGLRRRIIPIEFTDFFTKSGGVDVFFNAHFPTGWTESDWAGYDNLIAASIQSWIAGGCKLKASELSETGWNKQFEQEFGQLTLSFIEENWHNWVIKKQVLITEFNESYQAFCHENNISKKFELSSIKMNRALDEYCKKMGYVFFPREVVRNNGLTYKAKAFLEKPPF